MVLMFLFPCILYIIYVDVDYTDKEGQELEGRKEGVWALEKNDP